MAAPPQRKRIVPQQMITPTSPTGPVLASLAPLQVTDLQQQAELAPQLLGPGRKIWVDLKPFQESGLEVNWKKVLKERGIKSQEPKAAAPGLQLPEGNGEGPAAPLASLGQQRSKYASNPLAKVIARLERAYCAAGDSEEEESSDGQSEEQGEAEMSGEEHSDDEDKEEEEGEEGEGEKAGEGEGESGGKSGAEDKDKAAAGPKKKGGKGANVGEYDYGDAFIDDSEMVAYFGTKKRKTKHGGFFISKGVVEVEGDEMEGADDESDEEERARRKAAKRAAAVEKRRREQAVAAAGAGPGTARPGDPRSAESDGFQKPAKEGAKAPAGPKPAKKRKAPEGEGAQQGEGAAVKKPKKKAKPEAVGAAGAAPAQPKGPLSVAQLAMAVVQGAAQARAGAGPVSPVVAPRPGDTSAPASAVKKPKAAAGEPYVPPPDVLGAVDRVKAAASRCQPPTAGGDVAAAAVGSGSGGGEEGAGGRKALPAEVLREIRALAPLFQREKKRQPGAQPAITKLLMEFVGPFTTQTNLTLHLNKPKEGGPAKPPSFYLDMFKRAAEEHYKPIATAAAAGAEPGSDDDFQNPPPSQASPPLPSQRGAAGGGEGGAAPAAEQPTADLGKVPPKVCKAMFQYMDTKLQAQGKGLSSDAGRALVEEVVGLLPGGAVDAQRVQQIYEKRKAQAEAREARKQQSQEPQSQPAAQQQLQQPAQEQPQQQPPQPQPVAAAPTAGPAPPLSGAAIAAAAAAAGAAAATKAQGASQPPGVQEGAGGQAGVAGQWRVKKPKGGRPGAYSDDPQAYAALATQIASKSPQEEGAPGGAQPGPADAITTASQPPPQQQQSEPAAPAQQAGQQGQGPAAGAAVAAVAAAAAQPGSGEGQLHAGRADALPAGEPLAPDQVAVMLQLGSGAVAGALQPAPPPAPLVPRMTDEELVQAAVRAGAEEARVRDVLQRVVGSGRKWDPHLIKVLMLHGSQGLPLKAVQERAHELGFVTLEDSQKKWQSQKKLCEEGILAHVGKYHYALTCFPNVVHIPTRAEKDPKEEAKEGSASNVP